jgi:methylmalonyl-CoA mutase
LSKYVADAIQVIKAANYIIILELLELGNLIRNYGPFGCFLTPEFGAATQLEKSTCLILLTW